MDNIEIVIGGMRSGLCVIDIQTVTEQMEGVFTSIIDLDGKKGIFEIDSSKVTVEQIIDEISKLGYVVSIV